MKFSVGKFGSLHFLGHEAHFYQETSKLVYTEVFLVFHGNKENLWFLGSATAVQTAQEGLHFVVIPPKGSYDVLLKRHTEGDLRNPQRFAQATARKILRYLEQKEQDALSVRRAYYRRQAESAS